MLDEPILTCPVCAAPREFERPPCPDGHGADCPDLVCVECGMVLVVQPRIPAAPAAPRSRRTAA